MLLYPTQLDFSDKTRAKLQKYAKFAIERIRHKQTFYGYPTQKYKVPLNAPINIAHTTSSTVDYLYVKATTVKGRTKTYIFGLYSKENLSTLQDFLEKVKGSKP
jgi:hypothetical protein